MLKENMTESKLVFRHPTPDDGERVWQLVRDCKPLDLNSTYCYLLLCSHFSDTCVVAESGDNIIGFIGAYLPPGKVGVLFVWQVAVKPAARVQGLASRMLTEILDRDICGGVNFIETTVSPSNEPSRSLFHSVAHRLDTELQEAEGFNTGLFPGEDHESEPLFRIGPFRRKPRESAACHDSISNITVIPALGKTLADTRQLEGRAMRIFQEIESEVRGYIRAFPAVFDTAKGSLLFDERGDCYIDFFAGAGTLNYGHNHPAISSALIEYLQNNRIVHSLDKATVAKRSFLTKFRDTILAPRNLQYKVQFPGPTGTNAVETALKLARLVKKRSNIIAFTNGYHGLTMGSLAVTGNAFYRDESYGVRHNTDFLPFDGYFGPQVNTIEFLRRLLEDQSSGIDLPAAVIVETVQGEGGVHVASDEWLRGLEQICQAFDILLIVDDIQMGNGRTGTFFSFERAGIEPDMVTISKSIGGGLPLSLLLMQPKLDQWEPGEHTGTFRGNNLAFVAATQGLTFWENNELAESVRHKGEIMAVELESMVEAYPEAKMQLRGVGMVWGLEFADTHFASELSAVAFKNGVMIETAGAKSHVLKFLPPLVIEEHLLRKGLAIIDQSISELLGRKKNAQMMASA